MGSPFLLKGRLFLHGNESRFSNVKNIRGAVFGRHVRQAWVGARGCTGGVLIGVRGRRPGAGAAVTFPKWRSCWLSRESGGGGEEEEEQREAWGQ